MNIKEQMLLTDEEIIKTLPWNSISPNSDGAKVERCSARMTAQAQVDKCLSKFKEMIGEMSKISHFEVLQKAPVNSSHERVFEVTTQAQLYHSQQELNEKINELGEALSE